ncbi:5452_t:CDS:2 [Paraglomus occultum]|uniref:5452_t:CDS:1 n=1 Tax=Paraglomus occultum TaxID=144539 RepID=A0A9N9FY22_9GLOM|nr:5452_t:CDS:2 [Paraglomus occultum]
MLRHINALRFLSSEQYAIVLFTEIPSLVPEALEIILAQSYRFELLRKLGAEKESEKLELQRKLKDEKLELQRKLKDEKESEKLELLRKLNDEKLEIMVKLVADRTAKYLRAKSQGSAGVYPSTEESKPDGKFGYTLTEGAKVGGVGFDAVVHDVNQLR